MNDKKYGLIFRDPHNNENLIDLTFDNFAEGPPQAKSRYDLIFFQRPNNKNPINLVFGNDGEDDPVIEPEDHDVVGEIYLFEFSCDSEVEQDYGIDESIVTNLFTAFFNQSILIASSYIAQINEAEQLKLSSLGMWGSADLLTLNLSQKWKESESFQNDQLASWDEADVVRVQEKSFWTGYDTLDQDNNVAWNQAKIDAVDGNGLWYLADKGDRCTTVAHNNALFTDIKSTAYWGDGEAHKLDRVVKWNQADTPRCGTSVRPPFEPITPLPPDSWDIGCELVFCQKPNNNNPINIIFGLKCPENDTSIPHQKVYFVTNNIDIFRTKDGVRLSVFTVDLNADEDNYAWNGSASIPFNMLETVNDYPEIEININQFKWIMKVRSINETFVFNQRRLTISFSSVTDDLDKLKAISINENATAQQIAHRQLKGIGLDTGIGLDWKSQDWDIPANLIAYDSQTPLDVISRIMSASGDVLMSHYFKPELMTRKRYTQNYWDNINPIFTVPFDAVIDYSADEASAKSHDSVVVTAESVGVSALVRRFGYNGEYPADMIVESLITDEKVARQRGMNTINRSGVKQNVSVSMPLHKEIPYLYMRDAIAVGNNIGLVKSIGVNAALSNKTTIVRYNTTLEKHLRDNF